MFVLRRRALSSAKTESRKWELDDNGREWSEVVDGVGWPSSASQLLSVQSIRPSGSVSSQTQTPLPFEVGGGYTLFYLAKGHPQGG